MSEVIVITSGKGGVGKTTATANIGMGLARMKKRTVVIDTDIGLRNLDVVLGLENRIVYNMVDVIEGNWRMSGIAFVSLKTLRLSFARIPAFIAGLISCRR